jgi:hypothetical protein
LDVFLESARRVSLRSVQFLSARYQNHPIIGVVGVEKLQIFSIISANWL